MVPSSVTSAYKKRFKNMSHAKDVFEILMREQADSLLAFLRASVSDPHAVDDIFQETMIIAWRRLDDFDRSRSFGKWIRGIAGNLVLAHFRKCGKNPLSVDESTLVWLESRFAQLQSVKGDTLGEKLELLRECIAALSPEYRDTIDARYFRRLSLDEIVERTGVALQTVKKRLYRSKLRLENCINKKLLQLEGSA
jgi:RNA polymerase sigma-70 factor